MKSFMNDRQTLVVDAIDGLLASSAGADLTRLDTFPEIKVVIRADWNKDKVAVISGGGSGHEPAHAGFVGQGMLTAAICGEIFASPSVDAVLAAITSVCGEAGCLLIVKNYTGDRLNFGLAREQAIALGYKVEMVIVADDIALPDHKQPRGIAGTLFVHKLAGFMAEQGESLATVHRIAQEAAKATQSLGLALNHCNIPGAKETGQSLGDNEAELGLGIHGEPGAAIIPMQSADELVAQVADKLSEKLSSGDEIAILLNSLGGGSQLELSILMHALTKTHLYQHAKYIIGPAALMTSLDMRGFSISILPLNEERETALTQPVAVAAWPMIRDTHRKPALVGVPSPALQDNEIISHDAMVEAIIATIIKTILKNANDINELDAKIGDGDTGSTLSLGANSIADMKDKLATGNPSLLLKQIGERLLRSAGGSSGVLLAILFTSAAHKYTGEKGWATALDKGLQKMMEYGGAKLGDRTMIDALQPALETLMHGGTLQDAAKAARDGANKTATMLKANAGRSSYVSADQLQNVKDPGAEMTARIFEALASPNVETQ